MKIEDILLLLLLPSALCIMWLLYRLAKSRGRSGHWLWWGIHPLIGVFALLILYVKSPTSTAPVVRSARRCPKCQSPNIIDVVSIKEGVLPKFTILGYHQCQACGQVWERRAPLWSWYVGLIMGAGIFVFPIIYDVRRALSGESFNWHIGLGIMLLIGAIMIFGSVRGLIRAHKASREF